MGTSPPTQNAPTLVTDSASRVAAPASAAFPPCSRILMPAAVAAGLPETTTPWLPAATLGPRWLTGVLVACGQAKGASKRRETDDIEMILRIRGQLRCSGRHPLPAMSSRLYQLSYSTPPPPSPPGRSATGAQEARPPALRAC